MALHKRLLNAFRRNRVAREIEQEMAFHIAERVDDLMAQGMSREEARTIHWCSAPWRLRTSRRDRRQRWIQCWR